MQKILNQLQKIKQQKKTGLMTHIIAGCPDMNMCKKIVLLMQKNNVDFLEIQLPFSDPIADGKVMTQGNEIALKNGTTINDVFEFTKEIMKEINIPVIFVGYYNTMFKIGVEKFCKKARDLGVSGLLFPDIPFDEKINEGFFDSCKKYNLAPIEFISQTVTDERLSKINKLGKGFLYCTARLGITGTHSKISQNISSYLKKIKEKTDLPLAVGFGISNKDDIQKISKNADIAVIGSAIMKIVIDEKLDDQSKLKQIDIFLKNLV